MAITKNVVLTAILCSCFFIAIGEAAKGSLGGWRDEDPTDRNIQDLAKYAISDHNKLIGAKLLKYSGVISAKSQVVEGIMYDLKIKTVEGNKLALYQAKVWVKSWEKFKKVTEFKPVEA